MGGEGGRVGGNPNLGRSVLVCTKAVAFAAKLLKAHFVFSFDSYKIDTLLYRSKLKRAVFRLL